MLSKPHKKLDVWKKSIDLVEMVYELTQSFPPNESYGLTSQMRRAAVSISSNIAEGAARNTKKEFIQFLHVAQGSLSELDTQFEIAKRLGYLCENNTSRFTSYDSQLLMYMEDIDRMLTGLIKSLRRT